LQNEPITRPKPTLNMKKLLGLALFWIVLIGFYYSPNDRIVHNEAQSIDFQESGLTQTVTFLKEPLAEPLP